ncbi:MAG: 30S ribosomal protein S4, partial [Nitrospinaceae bacterium]
MARYTGSVCRLCRREGIKLFLKSERCETTKCAIDRRAYPPGQHGQGRSKPTEYGIQLREKQKVRRIYGVLEKQFRKYFFLADRKKGVTGEILLQLLETRLDNVIYRLGLAGSRSAARQLVLHRFFTVNGRRVNVPSLITKKGDVIGIAKGKVEKAPMKTALEKLKRKKLPAWLLFDTDRNEGTI